MTERLALTLGLVVIMLLIAVTAWGWRMGRAAEGGPTSTWFSGDGDLVEVTP